MAQEIASLYAKIDADLSGLRKGLQETEQGLENTKKKTGLIGKAFQKLTGTLGGQLSMAAVVGGMSMAVKTAGDFEAQVNVLAKAAGDADASLEQLRQAALKTGADSELVGISASQSAEALTNFYKAGLTTADIFGGAGGLNAYLEEGASLSGALRAAIDLQAASELDLASASDLVTMSLATFGIKAEEATAITDNFVQAADASVTSVPELAAALTNLGSTWASYYNETLGGVGAMKDMNTALALLSQYGISGAEAGTALKSMLTNLQRPSKDVQETLSALGISLYDAQGNMLRLPDIIGQFQSALSGLTQEQRNMVIQTVAGTYGMKAMNALMQEGLSGWSSMESAIQSASGAQEAAEARTQGFNAAMEALMGTLETLMITVGTPLINNVLTPLIRWAAKAGESLIPALEKVGSAFDTIKKIVDAFMGTPTDFPWEDIFPPGVADVMYKIGDAFEVARAWLQEKLPVAINTLKGVWEQVWPAIQAVLQAAWGTISGVLGAIQAKLAGFIEAAKLLLQGDVLGAIKTFVSTWVTYLSTLWDVVKTNLGPLAGQLFTWLQQNIPAALSAAGAFLKDKLWPALQTMITSAVDWVKSNAPTYAAALWGHIQTLLTTAWEFVTTNAATLANTLGSKVGSLVSTAVDWIKSNVPTYAANLWGHVQSLLTSAWEFVTTNAPTLANTLGGKIGGLVTTAVDWIKTNAPTYAATLWGHLQGFLTSAWEFVTTNATTLANTLGGKIGGLVTTAVDWVKTNAPTYAATLWGHVQSLLTSAWEFVTTNAVTLANTLGSKIGGLISSAVEWIKTNVPTYAANLWTHVQSLLTSAWEFVTTNAATLGNTLGSKIGGLISSAIEWVKTNVPTYAANLWAQVSTLLTNAWEYITTNGPTIASELGGKISSALSSAVDWLKDNLGPIATALWEKIKGLFTSAKDTFEENHTELGTTLGETFAKVLKGAINAIVTGVAGLGKLLFDAVKGVWDWITTTDWGTVIDNLFDTFKGIFSKSTSESGKESEFQKLLKEFFDAFLDGFMTELTGDPQWKDKMQGFFKDLVDKAKEGLDAKLEELKQKGKDLIQGLFDAIKSKIDEKIEDIRGLGRSIVDGIKEGITGAPQAIADGASNLVGNIVDGIGGFLKAHSPSRVMIPLGQSVAEGLAVGMAGGAPIVQSGFGPIQGVFDYIMSWLVRFAQQAGSAGLTAAGETFEDVADGIEDMANAFNAFAEGAARVKAGGVDKDAMLTYLDQWAWAAGEAVKRVQAVVEDVGWDVIGDMKGRATRLGTIMESVTHDLSALKPGDLTQINTYFDQFFEIVPMVLKRLNAMITDPDNGIGGTTLDDLAEWAKLVSETFVLFGAKLSEIKPSTANDFGAIAEQFVGQVFEFVSAVRAKTDTLTPDDIVKLEQMAEALPHMSEALGLLGHNLEVSLPKGGWSERLAAFLGDVWHAVGTINAKVSSMTPEAKEAVKGTAEVVPLFGDILSLLSHSIDVEEVKPGWVGRFQSFLGYVWHAVGTINARVSGMTPEAKEAVKGTAEVVPLFGDILSLLTNNIEVAEVEPGWVGRFHTFLGYVWHAVGTINDKIKSMSPEAKDAVKASSEVAGYFAKILEPLGISLDIKAAPQNFVALFKAHLANLSLALGDAKGGLLKWLGDLETEWGKETIDARAAIASALGPIFDLLNLGKTFEDLTSERQDDNVVHFPFEEALDRLIENMKTASTKLKTELPEIEKIWGDDLDDLTELAGKLQGFFEAIAGAFDSLETIAESKGLKSQAVMSALNTFWDVMAGMQGLGPLPALPSIGVAGTSAAAAGVVASASLPRDASAVLPAAAAGALREATPVGESQGGAVRHELRIVVTDSRGQELQNLILRLDQVEQLQEDLYIEMAALGGEI